MLWALWELQQYHKDFRWAFFLAFPLIPAAVYRSFDVLADIWPKLGTLVSEEGLYWVKFAEFCFIFLFHMALFYGIYGLSKHLEVKKVTAGAVRNAFVMLLYFVLYAISFLPFDFVADYRRVMSAPILLLQLCWILMVAYLIWLCYVHICPEGQEDVPLRVSRFAFVNKIRQEMERKEQKGIEGTIEHAKRNQKQYLEGKAKIDAMKKERMDKKKHKK